jgi:ferrochelatase
MPMSRNHAVLLMAYGGPDSLEDIEPYLMDVRGGRPTSPEFIKEIRDRYALIGGRSPLREKTEEQARSLEKALGNGTRVYVGMRHWTPFIAQTFEKMVADGVENVTAVAMAPHYSRMSVGAYRNKVEEAQAKLGTSIPVTFVESWHDHPLFLEAVAGKVRERLRESETPPAVIFTAHSLPERILQDGDPYHQQFVASAEGVARLLGLTEWHWAYQSAGSTTDKWLGPDVSTKLDELSARGVRDVLIVPIGFVCDHVEVLYDVDIYYRDYGAKRGMSVRRTESLNACPSFIRAISAIVRESSAP